LKKRNSILLLLIFCVYSFTFKTHYCYYADTGKRFHGDCGEFERAAEKKNSDPNASFHKQKYNCYNVELNKQYQQQDFSIKSFSDFTLILPQMPELPIIIFSSQKQGIPLFSCRGGPPLVSFILRGPPSC
jgi:hypothetical protein